MSKIIQDNLDTIDIPASGTGRKIVRLTPAQFLRVIRFRLTAAFSIPAAAVIHPDGLARFLTFRLLDGSDTPWIIDGDVLLQFQQNVFHTDADYVEVDDANSVNTGTWNGELWIADPALLWPDMTAMDARMLTTPKLQVEFNGAAAVCPTAAAAFDSGSIEFEAELVEQGSDMELARLTPWRRVQQYLIDDLKTDTADQRRQLEGGYFTSRLFLVVETNPTDASAIARSNDLVEEVELLINGVRRGKQSFKSLRSALRAMGGVNYPPKDGTGIFDFDPHKTLDKGTLLDLRGVKQGFEVAFGTGTFAAGCRVKILQENILEPDYAALERARAKAAGGR